MESFHHGSEAGRKTESIGETISRRSLIAGLLALPIFLLRPEEAAAQWGGIIGALVSGMMRGGYRNRHYRGNHSRHYVHQARHRPKGHSRPRVAHHSSHGSSRPGGGGAHAGGGGMGTGGY